MKETLKQGFVFIPDIGGNVHPLSHQWDDGPDAVASLNNMMKVRRKVLDNFSEKAIVANKANILFALSQIEAFKQDPDKFIPPPSLEMPPGAPIGMPGVLDDDFVF